MLVTKTYDEKTQRAILEFLRCGYGWIAYHCGNDGVPVQGRQFSPSQVGAVSALLSELCTWLAYNSHVNDSIAVEQQLDLLDKLFREIGADNPFGQDLRQLADTIRQAEEPMPELERLHSFPAKQERSTLGYGLYRLLSSEVRLS